MSEAEHGSDSAPELRKSQEPDKDGLFVNVFGRTDVGLVRDHNEDNFLVADLTQGNRSIKPEVRNHRIGPKGSLFAVCDGMGGAAAGEVASQIAVDTIYEMMQRSDPPQGDEELARRLEMAIVEAGLRIFTAAKLDRKRRGMGTTVTAAVMIGPRLLIGQVGDSRAYIYRKGTLIQVTKDQSLVQQLLDAKQLTEEEAKNFDKSNIILQALGTSEDVLVDVTSAVLRQDDVLIMCSDGLSGVVDTQQIEQALGEFQDPMEACRKLTDLACEGGGHDNITVIVSRFDGDELIAPLEDEQLSYRKFRYSASQDTTARRPMPPPTPDASDTQPVPILDDDRDAAKPKTPSKPEEEVKDIEDISPLPEIYATKSGGLQRGIFIAASFALVIGIGLIVWSSVRGGKSNNFEEAVPIQTGGVVENQPSQPELDHKSPGIPVEPAENDDGPALTMPSGGDPVDEGDKGFNASLGMPASGAKDVVADQPAASEERLSSAKPTSGRKASGEEPKPESAVAVNTKPKKRRPKIGPGKAKTNRKLDPDKTGTSNETPEKRQTKKKGNKGKADAGKSPLPKAKPLDDNPF